MDAHAGITAMPKKSFVTTSNAFEQRFGYHRAVRRGPFIAVSGTTALKLQDHGVHFIGNAEQQAKRGEDCDGVGRAFKEYFGTGEIEDGADDGQGVAATMLVVGDGFVDGDILVEVEVDAYVL
ncbi:hypothetical protein LTR66_017475 [Elasticomyces elasticus]|nr:hypothetical protein LTR66_017475 [Elasticomyces elasticus]